MAISFKDKIAYVNKFADKSDEKLQKVIKLSVNIESPKLNLTDAQKDKIKSSLQTAFERIKKIEDEKGVSKGEGKKLKTPNLLQLAKQIKQKQGITFEQARTKAKQAFAAKKSGQANAIQAVLQDFKKKVGKIEYSRATTGTDIKRDMERPALKAGKRKVTTQGSTTNAYGTFKNKVGKVYYESRANRMDVNQPSKKRYPKLGDGGYTPKYAKGGQMSGHFTFLPYKTEGNMYISTKLQGESPDSVMVRGVEGKLKGDDYKSAEYVAMVIMQEHPYVDRLEIIKRGASVMKNKKVAAFIRSNDNKDSYKIEYYADGGTLAGSLDVDNIGFGIMAKGGMFKVGDKVSSSMFTEGVIESKKKMGDDTMYFVTYQSSENPNKNNSTVLRESEMTKIRKSKMARGGLAEHGLKKGDTITDDMSWEDSVVVKNEKSGTRAKVNLNTGERKEAKMAKGGKVQYNRRKK